FFGDRDFFRFVVPAGGDESALAGSHHAGRRHQPDHRMDLAGPGDLVTTGSGTFSFTGGKFQIPWMPAPTINSAVACATSAETVRTPSLISPRRTKRAS